MSFTEKLKLIIDVDTTGASKGLSSLKGKMSEAEGFFGKLKAGAGGLRDVFDDLGPGAKAGLAAGGITALGTAAYSAVSQVSDLGVTIGEVADKTGLGAEEASRYNEVFNDLGISTETLEGVLGKMNKNLDPAKFKEYGIAIARAKDGTVDVNQTFLNTVDRLHNIADASERAKAGQDLFGKSWAAVAELVGNGADDLRDRLGKVADVKIFDEAGIKDARDFRDTMDDLHDAAQEVALTLGKALLPIVKDLASEATNAAHDLEPIIEGLTQVIDLAGKIPDPIKIAFEIQGNPIAAFHHAMNAATEVIDTNKMSLEDLNKTLKDNGISAQDSADILRAWHDANDLAAGGVAALAGSVEGLNTSLNTGAIGTGEFEKRMSDAADAAAAQSKRMDDEAAAVARADASEQNYVDTLHAEVDALHAAADAINEQISAAENAADSQLALNDASEKFSEAAVNTAAVLKDKGAASKDYKQAVDDERDALIAAAKAQQRLSDDQAAALDVTVTATQHIDDLNTALESQARFASPAARKAAYDYIGQLNQIPPEKLTEIQALIDQGKYDEADAAIKEVSRTREAAILADAKTAQAEQDLEALARDRTANIYARTIAIGGTLGVPHARGGQALRGEVAIVGEEGPELVQFGHDATVTPADKTKSLLGGGGGGGDTIIYNVRAIPTSRELAMARARARRRGFAA